MRHFKSKHFHFTWILAVLVAAFAIYKIEEKYKTVIVEIPKANHQITPSSNPTVVNGENPRGEDLSPEANIKSTVQMAVPFTPQAPTANWDELHNEACEEASMIMAHAYFSGMKDIKLEPDFVEEEITKLTEWEQKTFGYYLDINAEETAQALREVYGLQTKLIRNYTEEDIKKELSEGRLVLHLSNGRKLGNPNFRRPGPPYHMVVIRGYNSQGMVTNDPGTRNGQNYVYSYETLFNAGGDWSHNIHGVDEGSKVVVVVWK